MLEVQEFVWAEMSPHITYYDRFSTKVGLLSMLKHLQNTYEPSSLPYHQLRSAILCFQQSSIIDLCIEAGQSIVLKSSPTTEWFFEYMGRQQRGAKACVMDLHALPYTMPGLFTTTLGVGPFTQTHVVHYGRIAAAGAFVAGVAYFFLRG